MEELKSIGKLFDSINYDSQEHLEMFLENLDENQSFYVINEALGMAYKVGVYNLQEAEFISKATRILLKKFFSDDRKGEE